MSSLSNILPEPRNTTQTVQEDSSRFKEKFSELVSQKVSHIPPYGKRVGWKPRAPEDYGNGGAFPEIHIAQYPLEMGRKKQAAGRTIAPQVDAEGNVKYDAIANQGHSDSRLVQSHFKDLVPLGERAELSKVSMERPSEEEVQETADRTRAALEKIVSGKIAAAQPKNVNVGEKKGPQYVRYTPNQQGDGFNSGAQQRIIRMVEMPVDPLDPPKFQHRKIPRGPPSPPVTVLHSPPRKLTAQQQSEWVIPPVISNWKNPRGFTIPLDKRLAADGRGLQDVTINDNFAKLSEALFAADRHAREEVRQRNLMQQRVAQKQKEAEEEKLRLLAQRAREERAGIVPRKEVEIPYRGAASSSDDRSESDSEDDRRGSRRRGSDNREDDDAARQREELRRDRQRDRERELRLNKMGTETRMKVLAKEQGRDISEKIALGLAKPTFNRESMYDSRLFNQSEGIGSGFGDEESYSLYDKGLFQASSVNAVYRPKKDMDSESYGGGSAENIEKIISQDRFGSRGFKGAESSSTRGGDSVQFERETIGQGASASAPAQGEKVDPFGLDQFLSDAKRGKRGHDDDKDSGATRKKAKDLW